MEDGMMKSSYERAQELTSRMTLREKVGQLAQNFYGFEAYTRDEQGQLVLTDAFKRYVQRFGGIGMLNNYFRADPWCKKSYRTGGIVLAEREHAYNLLQHYLVEHTRLGIPVLIEEDAPHGRQVLDSVLYPVSLNVGCSFQPEVYRRQTEQIGMEAKLGGVHVPYLSVLDMAVDPRWGRCEECFSEDPFLSAKMSEAAVRGMKDSGSMVCCKHFAAQGAAVGGHNGGAAQIGERELREIHLPAARAAVRAGCDFIMAAYNEIDGVPCHANRYLLNGILRGEMHFSGVIRSDGCAIDMLREICGSDLLRAGALALSSGVDCGLWDQAFTRLDEAMEKGYLSEAELDRAVTRLLEKKYACGVMDTPYLPENGQSAAYILSGTGQKAAYEMAAESLVLLKNKSAVLPIAEESRVLLIGGNLDDIYYLLGDYTSERKQKNTIKDEFERDGAAWLAGWRFESGVHTCPAELAEAAADADVIIFGCGGSSVRDFESQYNAAGAIRHAEKYMDCGEGRDLAQLHLPKCQMEVLRMIRKLGKPIVSLVIGGRPYVLTDIMEQSDAVVWCGYPGQEGAKAIKNTLYGKENRFGRLSVSFPRSAGQIPVCYNGKKRDPYVDICADALLPFGFGLSYAAFAYTDFMVETATLEQLAEGGSVTVRVTVKNTSDIAGADVPQLYLRRVGGTVTHRRMELRGFEKVFLRPGESRRICMRLGREAFEEWSVRRCYELAEMDITLMLGRSSAEIIFEESFRLCHAEEVG